MKETQITGRLWVLTDRDGRLYDDIDTDMIFHNRYLHITDMDWEPNEDPHKLGARIREERNINPSTNCSTCHR